MLFLSINPEQLLANLRAMQESGGESVDISFGAGISTLRRANGFEPRLEAIRQPSLDELKLIVSAIGGEGLLKGLERSLSQDLQGAVQGEWRGFPFVIKKSLFGFSLSFVLRKEIDVEQELAC